MPVLDELLMSMLAATKPKNSPVTAVLMVRSGSARSSMLTSSVAPTATPNAPHASSGIPVARNDA